ncbi:MAG: hypothetical protein QUV05_20115 [Phycisphaerae bacterium]|nr:hypothetical protein [Phycisphaerae bacterium]
MSLMPYNKGEYDPLKAMELLKRVDICIQEVKKASAVLPRVNSDGQSACNFVESLYARKEHWQRELQVQYGQLHEFRAAAAAEVKRHGKNRDVIESNRERLHGEKVKLKYGEAENQLEAEGQLHMRMCRRLEQKIKLVEQILGTASESMFPHRRPQTSHEVAVPSLPRTGGDEATGLHRPEVDTELSDLMAIDRERRTGGPPVFVQPIGPYHSESKNASAKGIGKSDSGNRRGATRRMPGFPNRI